MDKQMGFGWTNIKIVLGFLGIMKIGENILILI